jgi:hypothetical protein
MPPKRAKKVYPIAILIASFDVEPAHLSLPSPLPLPPLDCLPLSDPFNEPTIDKPTQQERPVQTKWTAEMIKALIECIYKVWKDSQAADNRV